MEYTVEPEYSLTPIDGDPYSRTTTVGDAIDVAAKKYGLNPAVLKGIASIESSWNPESNRKRKDTQYKGLFQIGYDEWKKNGSGDIYKAEDNANAAAKMLSEHAQWFKDNYGREPTPGELYMMHQQGRGHFTRGALTNVAGNAYPGMRGPQTPESFRQGWSNELDRRIARYGDGGSVSDGIQQPVATAPIQQTAPLPVRSAPNRQSSYDPENDPFAQLAMKIIAQNNQRLTGGT